jgi:hypothetical protein
MRDNTMTTKNTVTLNGKEYDIDTLLDEPISQQVDSKLSESKKQKYPNARDYDAVLGAYEIEL